MVAIDPTIIAPFASGATTLKTKFGILLILSSSGIVVSLRPQRSVPHVFISNQEIVELPEQRNVYSDENEIDKALFHNHLSYQACRYICFKWQMFLLYNVYIN